MRDRVFIVGGGPSVEDTDLSSLRGVDTIVTNVAIFDVPNPNYFITMDYTFMLKIAAHIDRFRSIDTTKMFIVGLHHKNLIEKRGRITDIKNKIMYDLHDFNMIVKSYKEYGIGFSWNEFRSGLNSGYCALQLAILLGYTDIYLLGMDLLGTTGRTHYHNYYQRDARFQNKLEMYDEIFKTGLLDISNKTKVKVSSCSLVSSLNDRLTYVPVEEVL